jgi:hypothetical protein
MQKSKLKLYIQHDCSEVIMQWLSTEQITTPVAAKTAMTSMLDAKFIERNETKINQIAKKVQ